MNRITVFNPEHDLALANGSRYFIAPKNIREMARDLAPLLDVIEGEQFLVWGWDGAIKEQLLRMGIAENQLPTDAALTALRACSERKSGHHLLRAFHADFSNGPYTGESIIAHCIDDIVSYATRYGHIVLKDPLSSSGKGLRHVNIIEDDNENFQRDALLPSSLSKVESWANALIKRHGYLTAEPFYNKVQDFAMEFCIRDGKCHFIGYSFFNTNHHGRYESNLLMADEKIENRLAQHIPHSALHEVRDWIISNSTHIIPTEWDTAKHPLYFGIDMMVVETTNKVAFEREQRLLADSAERSNFNEVNGQQTTDAIRKANFQFSKLRLSESKGCLQTLPSIATSTESIHQHHHPEANFQLSIFNSQFQLHPCVEINLRLNMGIIAHQVRRKLLAPDTEGTFHVTAFPTEEAAQQFHQEYTTKYPPVYREGKIVSGYHPLTPIHSHTRHHAYVICG